MFPSTIQGLVHFVLLTPKCIDCSIPTSIYKLLSVHIEGVFNILLIGIKRISDTHSLKCEVGISSENTIIAK